MEWIFAGIDGTGVSNDEDYAKEFANSFVKQLRDNWSHQSLALYWRGPANLGLETKALSRLALHHVGSLYEPGRAVVLAGYSRGAAAVIETAWTLSRYTHIPVHCLILFDSVDRAIGVGGLIADTPIAKNVKHCIHAIRADATGSRSGFGGCGTKIEDQNATQYKSRQFYGTHGALGGTPWTNVEAAERIDERRPWERKIKTALQTATSVSRIVPIVPPILPNVTGILPNLTGTVTNVTGAQDAACVRDVWAWTTNEMATAFYEIERDMAEKMKPTG